MKNLVILFLLIFSNLVLKAQSVYIFEIGSVVSSQTNFLNSGLLNNGFSGINVDICYHKQFNKIALQYKLGVSRITQIPSSSEPADIFYTESEIITSSSLDKIHDFTLGIGGLLPLYKKYLFISLDISVIDILPHNGVLNSDLYSHDQIKDISTKTKSIEYSYDFKNTINPMLGIGTFFLFPLGEKFSLTGRLNLNFLLGSNDFSARQIAIGNNLYNRYDTQERRFYIDDFLKANLGVGYTLK